MIHPRRSGNFQNLLNRGQLLKQIFREARDGRWMGRRRVSDEGMAGTEGRRNRALRLDPQEPSRSLPHVLEQFNKKQNYTVYKETKGLRTEEHKPMLLTVD